MSKETSTSKVSYSDPKSRKYKYVKKILQNNSSKKIIKKFVKKIHQKTSSDKIAKKIVEKNHQKTNR